MTPIPNILLGNDKMNDLDKTESESTNSGSNNLELMKKEMLEDFTQENLDVNRLDDGVILQKSIC